jgi:hypothetical protein
VKRRARGLRSRIYQRASRGHALSKAQEKANHQKSKVRARVEHVFGAQHPPVPRGVEIPRSLSAAARSHEGRDGRTCIGRNEDDRGLDRKVGSLRAPRRIRRKAAFNGLSDGAASGTSRLLMIRLGRFARRSIHRFFIIGDA